MDTGTFKATGLPALKIAGAVNDVLSGCGCAVVTAPPGAGKSTIIPLTILGALLDDGRILMLEPRRIAARQIAGRMASLLGEPVGRTVGYRIRFESKVSSGTRIEVLTEGILTRMLVDDPTLEGVSVVIFDEFHERSLVADEALALVRESRDIIRPDLKLVVMSATIDAAPLCEALGAVHVHSEGRCFPVERLRLEESTPATCAEDVARAVLKAHREYQGDILAFLPGEAEIRRCEAMLAEAFGTSPVLSEGDSVTNVLPLYGMLDFEKQKKAIAPGLPGERRVVLATPIAETSLTIEGVRVVVDSGFCRKMVFNPQNGLSRMETVRISLDMADQRAGRAGRVAPGVCYRLWSAATESRMAACRTPEILEADLAPLALDVAAWGASDPAALPWITPPPAYSLSSAAGLLESLGAVDVSGFRITPHGRKLASLPCHPRIAQMLLAARTTELKALACDIAAILEERDPMPDEGTDLVLRVDALRRWRTDGHVPDQYSSDHSGRKGRGNRVWNRISDIAAQYRRMAGVKEDNSTGTIHGGSLPLDHAAGFLLANAWPERIAKARDLGHYLLAGGGIAGMDLSDAMTAEEWIVVASLDAGKSREGHIFQAAALDPAMLLGTPSVRERDNVSWDSRNGMVIARHEQNIGMLLLSSRPIHDGCRDEIVRVICEAARKEGTSMLDFSEEVGNLQRRVAFVAQRHPELELPSLDTEDVLEHAPEWLPPYVGKCNSSAELRRIDLAAALWAILDYDKQQAVGRLAPTHIEVPTGSRIRVEYRQGADAPVLRVRLQECFGMQDTPKVDGGRCPVLMELLSPGFKPVQLTSDLHSFWENTYFEVRKELRRRYPKHSWPDNPLEAPAVRGVRR